MADSNNQFTLLKGNFSSEEAKEILTRLFNDKVHYHRLRNFSHEERFGEPEPHTSGRIAELKKTLECVMTFLSQYEGDATFEIHADINIMPVER